MILSDMVCKPIMVVSINTLYLYDNLILKSSLTNIIDSFLCNNATCDESTGKYEINGLADFDNYLRRNPFNKSNDVTRWLNKTLKKS